MFGSDKKDEIAALQATIEELQGYNLAWQAQHETDARIIAMHETTAASNRDTIDWMRDNLEANKVANGIGEYALSELRKVQNSGEVLISAQDVARDVVAKRLVSQATAEQANQLIADEEREQRKNFGPEEIKLIRANLDETFKGDGTYTRLGNKIETDVRQEISAELVQAETERLAAHYGDPTVQAAIHEEEAAKLKENGTLDTLASDMRANAEAEWSEIARQEVQESERAKLEAIREQRINELGQAWLQSEAGQAYVADLTESLEAEWEKAGREAVAERLGDTVLLEVLQRLNEKNKLKLEREQQQSLDLKEFMRGGIDMLDIPKDTLVTIYLGTEGRAKGRCIKSVTGGYYKGSIYGAGDGYHCTRIITLISAGSGSYIAGDDVRYLQGYDGHKQQAITAGSIVQFGSYKKDGKEVIRTGRVVQGVPFLCTVDGEEVSSTYVPVALAINNKLSSGKDVFIPVE